MTQDTAQASQPTKAPSAQQAAWKVVVNDLVALGTLALFLGFFIPGMYQVLASGGASGGVTHNINGSRPRAPLSVIAGPAYAGR